MPKRQCCGCKERFPVEDMIKRPVGWFHSFDCSISYAMYKQLKQRSKAARVKLKADKKAHVARREAIKPVSKLKAEAQASFNKYIRMRDYWEPCISCNAPRGIIEAEQGWKVGGCWDAGHFKSRGAKKQLRFNTFNVHKQCKSCNGGGGRFSAKAATVDAKYEVNLIEKIGLDKVTWLNNNNDIVKFEPDYYRRIKKIFNKRARLAKTRIGI